MLLSFLLWVSHANLEHSGSSSLKQRCHDLVVEAVNQSESGEVLARAVTLLPEECKSTRSFKIALAASYTANGDFARAADILEKVVDYNGTNPYDKEMLLAAYLGEKSFAKADQLIGEVKRRREGQAIYELLKGEYCSHIGDFDCAASLLSRATKVEATYTGLSRLAIAYYNLGRYQEGVVAFDAAASSSPFVYRDVNAVLAGCYSHYAVGDIRGAEEILYRLQSSVPSVSKDHQFILMKSLLSKAKT